MLNLHFKIRKKVGAMPEELIKLHFFDGKISYCTEEGSEINQTIIHIYAN